ncbi:uncharacterized protein KD926_002380 [Aspergillus affinis]|uniref:uncharacterized protein n=1 Tax=Aspergillus affinis TaxID=1070780 RepID=UPI0022FE1E2B|nr:uncharacterized protein KD926_002380 [Aspergillus affinis]KAI9044001.1 secreted protein [Aspergillus affinis]
MPPKRAAAGSTAASKRQKTTPTTSVVATNHRWAAVSGTGNIYAGYIEQMAKDPEGRYAYKCLCRPPFPDGDYESDEEGSLNEGCSDSEHDNKTNANDKETATGENPPAKPRCDGGKTCLCKKPVAEHPDHPWAFTHAGLSKFIDLRLCGDLRCPDFYDMYTFNDHHSYGIMEVVENLILDFDEAKEDWKEQWAMCEAAVLFLLCGEADPMKMADDGERVSHVHTLIARMFLTILAKLEAQDALKPESEVKNLGVIMAVYMKYIHSEANELSDVTAAKKFQFDQAPLHILAYAKKHGIKLRGPADIDELVEEVEAEQEEKIRLPAASAKDPWNWADGLKKYAKDHVGKLADMGGDNLDLTTWSSAERKKKSFNNKDCFSKKAIDGLKDGMILQAWSVFQVGAKKVFSVLAGPGDPLACAVFVYKRVDVGQTRKHSITTSLSNPYPSSPNTIQRVPHPKSSMHLPNLLSLGLLGLGLASTATAAPKDSSTSNSNTPSKTTEFTHPGVFLDSAQLKLIASRVSAKKDPQAAAYDAMMDHEFASRTEPSPFATVECGPTSTPDVGCHEEREDALTAYLNALAWVITGTKKYADRAIEFMNAWSGTIEGHSNSNAPLQAAWSAASWARAGEIIRYSKAGWKDSDVKQFEGMLRDVYLPEIIDGAPGKNGNWELVMMEAALGISVFINDRESYDKAMKTFLARVPAYIYLTKDGKLPKTSPEDNKSSSSSIIDFWQGQSTFPENGISQETCRDFAHTGYGIASIAHVAETSRIQGRDLYEEDTGERLRYALGFHTKYQLQGSLPGNICGGDLKRELGDVTEVAFNGLSFRGNHTMTNTDKYTLERRPAGTDKLFIGWETLTHAENDA